MISLAVVEVITVASSLTVVRPFGQGICTSQRVPELPPPGPGDKSELRTPKLETNPKHQGTNDPNRLLSAAFGALGHLIFGFVSGFGFRIWKTSAWWYGPDAPMHPFAFRLHLRLPPGPTTIWPRAFNNEPEYFARRMMRRQRVAADVSRRVLEVVRTAPTDLGGYLDMNFAGQ